MYWSLRLPENKFEFELSKASMKIFNTSLALFAGASALAVSKESASEFLRVRRANSVFEEWKSGNLERECIEEACDATEFHEVYDDMAVSGPLLVFYLKSVLFNNFMLDKILRV